MSQLAVILDRSGSAVRFVPTPGNRCVPGFHVIDCARIEAMGDDAGLDSSVVAKSFTGPLSLNTPLLGATPGAKPWRADAGMTPAARPISAKVQEMFTRARDALDVFADATLAVSEHPGDRPGDSEAPDDTHPDARAGELVDGA